MPHELPTPDRPAGRRLPVRLATLAACLCTSQAPALGGLPHPEAQARAHIAAFAGHTLHASDHSYRLRDVLIDEDGTQHVRFDREHRGRRVIGGDLVVHSARSGSFLHASRTLEHPITVPASARVTAASAHRAASAGWPGLAPRGQPELVVYARSGTPALAWDVRLSGHQANGLPSERHVIVDATTAAILESWDDIHAAGQGVTGQGKGFYSGTVPLFTTATAGGFELRDPSRGGLHTVNMAHRTSGSGTVFKDTDNTWGTGALASAASVAVDAQYGAAMTWDYFKTVHGRLGIANDGRGSASRVHYGSRFANAFWSDDCFCMTYGDGDGSVLNPLVALDVAGHEMTHGITSRTAGLVYAGESGGLNEATSDIFGTAVEFHARNGRDAGDYLIGERLFRAPGRFLRSMSRPSLDGASADCWYAGVGHLDVHLSSGVANHFFFLLAEGTVRGAPSPTCEAGDRRVATGAGTLAGIGRVAAEKIWYRALTVYMTSGTNYARARAATLKAAADLHGAGSPTVQAVEAAWSAVNVR